EAAVREIIETAAASEAPEGTDERKIGDLYASFMDEAAVEAAGATPIIPLLERVDGVTDAESLMWAIGALGRQGVPGIMGMAVMPDKANPERTVLHLIQSGIGLPDESYYRVDTYAPIREKYLEYLGAVLPLAGVVEASAGADAAQRILALETLIAAAHWERTELRDAVKTYNLTDADGVRKLVRVADAWFAGLEAPSTSWAEVVVMTPSALDGISTVLEEADLEDWKLWLKARVVTSFAPYLSSAIVDAYFAFHGTVLTGAPTLRERWKRGVGLVESTLGEAVGRLYVERHYPERSAAAMNVLVTNLREAYRERITSLEWMESQTRQRALAKLDAFTPKVGNPAKWRDYSELEIRAGDLVGNVQRAARFGLEYELGKVNKPVDRDEWHMTPQTVNAYYNPLMNEIVFPAAILQPPFFDADIDPAYNYGGIGAIIGHEIGHGFDDQGSRYDGDGTLRDWWTPTDRERFDAKTKALIDQYNAYSPRALADEHTVNGALTVGENIGDLGGVAVAHHAYRLSLGGEEAPVIDGLTGDERFFIGWARAWRTIIREAEAVRRLAIDPHSPSEFRCNVVRNVDAFHETFHTAPGDGLWLAPDERIAIW
ncbi:MAG TPA: M13-type metalloendopeptidase, partial [Acidimicrobiales bacterium]|nr:M13-type metalloendopeptidase [Acidimicrobiales bacterium]